MPFPVQIQRLSRALQRLLGHQGPLPLTIIEDAFPVLPLADASVLLYARHRGERVYGRHITRAAVAGQFGNVYLVNPATSQQLVMLELLEFIPAAAAGLALDTDDAANAPGGGVRGVARDPWLPDEVGADRSVAGVQDNTTAGTSQQLAQFAAKTEHFLAWDRGGVVLAPGMLLRLGVMVVNTAVEATLWWREVPLAPAEVSR